MARRSRQPDPIVEFVPGDPQRISGGKLIDLIERPLRALRTSGALPLHGNRTLQADHILIAHLVAFFNPVAASLRRIEDVFESPQARRRFGLPQVPRSTLSDAQALYDPALLAPLIEELKSRLPKLPHDPRLDEVTRQLTVVDGTFFAMLPRVLWALHHKHDHRKAPDPRGHVRVDLHLDLLHGTPEAAVVSGSALSEHASLAQHARPGRFYVLDRGYQSYAMLQAILDAPSDFLVRFRHDQAFDMLAQRPLSADDRLAGVVSDCDIRIHGHRAEQGLKDPSLRRIEIQPAEDAEPVILLTNRTDLPAELLALIYRHRWQIELFFRWLKCLAGFGHFLSESQAGVSLQIYAALIGTLLLAVWTGSKPSVYAFSTMNAVMNGLIAADEAPAIIARRMAIAQRDAERAKARRAAKQAAQAAQKTGR